MTLLKPVIKPLGLLGLTAASSAIDAGVQVISNEEMNDIMKIGIQILLKGVTKTIKNGTKEQKGGFLSALLGTPGANLLGDLLTKIFSGKGTVRAGEGIKKKH